MKQLVKEADVLIITAGAGMGIDSGMPDFRGTNGLWTKYAGQFSFQQCANPAFLKQHPRLFWGFYGQRLNMYRHTKPHEGYQILQDICKDKEHFVVTSNVDGHFQKIGFTNVYEVHGSIHHFQCNQCQTIIDANQYQDLVIKEYEAQDPLPHCQCERLIRPNILMFCDYDWIPTRSDEQEQQFKQFLTDNKNKKLLILELGAGTAIPTLRNMGDKLVRECNAKLIRINPYEFEVPQNNQNYLVIKQGALEALTTNFL